MRVLIVADVHSNLEAFTSVIGDASRRGGFSEIWSLGDLVGYGPDPAECLNLLGDHDHRAVAGNHDLAAAGRLSLEAFNEYAAEANLWTATQLTPEQKEGIGALPLKIEHAGFTLVHGSPRDPVWEYVVSQASAAISFLHFDTSWCLLGHSHVPFLCRPVENTTSFLAFPEDSPVMLDGDRMIMNPGSVGQPRDGDPRASYAVYDSNAAAIYHHRTEYDIAETQRKMTDAGLPRYLIDRLPLGR